MDSASVATLARFAYVHYLIDPKNLIYHLGLVVWSLLEAAIAIVASSAATLRPLLALLASCCSRHGQSNESQQQFNPYTESRHQPSHRVPTELSDIESGGNA